LQVYAPHSGRPEEESDTFYAQLNDVIAGLTGAMRRNVMVLGDFNAELCSGELLGGCVGPFALGRQTTPMGSLWSTCDIIGVWPSKAHSSVIDPTNCILGTQMPTPVVSLTIFSWLRHLPLRSWIVGRTGHLWGIRGRTTASLFAMLKRVSLPGTVRRPSRAMM
jgi:hypothetical protein